MFTFTQTNPSESFAKQRAKSNEQRVKLTKNEQKVTSNEQVTKSCTSLQWKQQLKIYQFKVKNSKFGVYPLCLGNISKHFPVEILKETRLNGYVFDFSVDFESIDVDDMLDIHKYLMKKPNTT